MPFISSKNGYELELIEVEKGQHQVLSKWGPPSVNAKKDIYNLELRDATEVKTGIV